MIRRQLGVFGKYWAPGEVKTRLAKEIGASPAAELYRLCLRTTLDRAADIAGHKVLAFWPGEHEREFAEISSNRWNLELQADGELGCRMSGHFRRAFADGFQAVVLIGSDSPTLPMDFIEQAFHALRTQTIVLGPSTDGGYYLIGMSKFIPALFEGIPWSSPAVWSQTVLRICHMQMTFAELPIWYDVDDFQDLTRLKNDVDRRQTTEQPFTDLSRWLNEHQRGV